MLNFLSKEALWEAGFFSPLHAAPIMEGWPTRAAEARRPPGHPQTQCPQPPLPVTGPQLVLGKMHPGVCCSAEQVNIPTLLLLRAQFSNLQRVWPLRRPQADPPKKSTPTLGPQPAAFSNAKWGREI